MIARLVCRLREHDDAVLEVSPGSAVLWCVRCDRRQVVHNLARMPSLTEAAEATEVALVDRGALSLLWATAAVEAAYAERATRELEGGSEEA